jgi:AcrR family transcriptional regulator
MPARADASRNRPRRRDAQQRREKLLAAVGELLAEGRREFTLTYLAELAGVSVATAYRNFPDTPAAITAYADELTTGLLEALSAVPDTTGPVDELRAVCHAWIDLAAGWGPALVHLRSPEGVLARRAAGDPFIVALHRRLDAVLRRCVTAGVLPPQDLDFAVLTWITLLDERVIIDLTQTLRWPVAEARRQLTGTLLAALRATTAE